MDGSERNCLGRFLGGKASPSSFLVTIASRVWRLQSKNAVNREFLRFSGVLLGVEVESVLGEWAISMAGVEEGREFRFRGDLYSQESTFPLVLLIISVDSYCNVHKRHVRVIKRLLIWNVEI